MKKSKKVYYCNIKEFCVCTLPDVYVFKKKYCKEADDKESFTKCMFASKKCNKKYKITECGDANGTKLAKVGQRKKYIITEKKDEK